MPGNQTNLIDERLFAHINNDPFLAGSYELQGQTLLCTISYLQKYVSHCTENKIRLPEGVYQLLSMCQVFAEQQRILDHCNENLPENLNENSQIQHLSQLAANWYELITQARLNKTAVLLPGGWSSSHGSHALVYQFEPLQNDDIVFTVHNSGDGLLYHPRIDSLDKALYSPAMRYKISAENLSNKEFFCAILQALIKARVSKLNKNQCSSSAYFYKIILERLHYLKAELILPQKEEYQFYTGGQLSGTCAQRSIHQMVKARFQSVDDYRQFILGFKTFALDEYMQELKKTGKINHPDTHPQVEKAIRHLLRLVNVEKSQAQELLFSTELRRQLHQKCTQYLKLIREARPDKTKSDALNVNSAQTKPLALSLVNYKPLDEPAANRNIPAPELINPMPAPLEGEKLFDKMRELLKEAKRLDSINARDAGFELLEQFFLQLPLPKSKDAPLLEFYKKAGLPKDAEAFFILMTELQELYFCLPKSTGVGWQRIPRLLTVKASNFAVCLHVYKHSYFHQSSVFLNLLESMPASLGTSSDRAVYLANHNPTLDFRLEQVRALYTKPNEQTAPSLLCDYEKDLAKHYLSIIETYPNLKQELITRYHNKYTIALDPVVRHDILKNNYEALFSYLNHKEVKNLEQFSFCNQLFEQQIMLEFVFLIGLSTDFWEAGQKPIAPSFSLKKHGVRLESNFTKGGNPFAITAATVSSIYPIRELYIKDPLFADVNTSAREGRYLRESKRIQLCEEHLQKASVAQRLEGRELYHLRHHPSSQILLTLDYFIKHPDKLENEDLQTYVEANLFQPGLLLNLLNNQTESMKFWPLFDKFIDQGIDYACDSEFFSSQSVFYAHMLQAISVYAYAQNPKIWQDRLWQCRNKLNLWLSQPQHPEKLAHLHCLRFLAMNAQLQHNPKLTPSELVELFESCFVFKAHPLAKAWQSTGARHNLEHAYRQFMYQAQAMADSMPVDTILERLCTHQLIPARSQWQQQPVFDFPTVKLTTEKEGDYVLDLLQGLICKEAMLLVHTPDHISEHPVVKLLQMSDSRLCLTNTEQTVFILENASIKLRLTRHKDYYTVEQQFAGKNKKSQWFELVGVNSSQAQLLKLNPKGYTLSHLPGSIAQRYLFCWVSVSSSSRVKLFFTDSDNKIKYTGSSNTLHLSLINASNGAMVYNELPDIPQVLSQFESKNFTITTRDDKGNIYYEMPRYDLKFSKPVNSTHFLWHHEDKIYRLDEKQPLQSQGLPGLCFADQSVCILPVNRWLATQKRHPNCEYYQFHLDNEHLIAKDMLNEKNNTKVEQADLWHYENSATKMVLKLKNGAPCPQTAAEALYLCYLYLGSHQPEKALTMLDYCDKQLGGLQGCFEELSFIAWICEALPYQPSTLKDSEKKSTLSTPPVVACQLKALSLWTSLGEATKLRLCPKSDPNSETPNAHYEWLSVEQVRTFNQSSLQSLIYSLYHRYQLMRRDIPIHFILSESESRSLLNYFHDQLPVPKNAQPKAIGSFDYDWLRLNLLNLKREQQQLLQRESLSPHSLSQFEKSRLKEISRYLKKHPGIYKTQSDLAMIKLKLDIDFTPLSKEVEAFKWVSNLFSESKKVSLSKSIQIKITKAMEQLTPNITESLFVENFGCYVLAATVSTAARRKQIEAFCIATLKASRFVKLKNQPTRIPILCNLLYRAVCKRQLMNEFPLSMLKSIHAFAKLQNISPQPIYTFQLQNEAHKLLISANTIHHGLPDTKTQQAPQIPTATRLKLATQSLFENTDCHQLLNFGKEWQQTEYAFYHPCDSVSESDTENSLKAETEAGKHKFQQLKQLKALARTCFKDSETINTLNQSAANRLKLLKAQQQQALQKLLSQANKGPQSLENKVKWDIDIDARKRKPLDINNLLALYLKNDMLLYREATELDDEAIIALHGEIAFYLQRGLFIQQLTRIQQETERFLQRDYDTLNDNELLKIGQTVFAVNLADIIDEPLLCVFQYHENLLLRPHQVAGIKRFLANDKEGKANEVVLKILMGGGKSKVFSPILAYQKAQGDNLVIIEVPAALLKTNFTDLKASSNRLFNQTAVLFEFSRDSDCSPKQLNALLQKFADVMVNKNYLVTTGESIQSLELKYLELLSARPSSKAREEEWEQKIKWIEQLVLFLRHRGDCIIDEIHQGLLFKNRLNYSLGHSAKVPRFIIEKTLSLYGFLQHVPLKNIPSLTMASLLKAHKPLKTREEFEAQSLLLVDALFTHQQSPLLALLSHCNKNIGPKEQGEIKAWFLNKADTLPPLLTELPMSVLDILALYKEQSTHLLAFTLHRKANVNFGPSKSSLKSSLQQAVAIPYSANDKPNERSQFGNEIETMNYTIQAMLINGVSKPLLKLFLQQLQQQASQNAKAQQLKTINDTPLGHLFKVLSNGLLLSDVKTNDAEYLGKLHQMVRHNQALIFEVLQTLVLLEIQQSSNVLCSNALHHIDALARVQGFSGTPWNVSTFHSRLSYERSQAFGTDGYIIQCLLDKKTPVQSLNFKQPDKLISRLLTRYRKEDEVKAIIDISAAFNGLSNEEVARSIAAFIQQTPESFCHPRPINHVLFFNTEDELCAVPVEPLAKASPALKLGSSSPENISQKLGSSVEERFTYYDQAHTLGTDILQGQAAKAVVLCDPNTSISPFLQGVLRMRGVLEGQQSLDIFVAGEIVEQKSLETLCNTMQTLEQKLLRQDNFSSAFSEPAALVRADLLKRLLALPYTATEKSRMYQLVENLFVETQSTSLFERFGGISKVQGTRNLLQRQKVKVLEDWKAALQKLNLKPLPDEETKLTEQINYSIEKACKQGVCDPEQLRSNNNEALQVELQKEVEIEREIEQERVTETLKGTGCYTEYVNWIHPYAPELESKTLNEILAASCLAYYPEFSQYIEASINFYEIVQNQSNYLGSTMFPVHAIYFKKQNNILRSFLLSPQELPDAIKHIANKPKLIHWISTTSHIVLAGNRPKGILEHKEYQSLIEQIRFFAGDLKPLAKDISQLNWLCKETKEKLDFFQRYLSGAREYKPEHLIQLRQSMAILNSMLEYISKFPDRDPSHYDWRHIFPDADESEVREITQGAKLFYKLSGAWWQDASLESLTQSCSLSLMTLGYLRRYQDKLNKDKALTHIKQLFATLNNQTQDTQNLNLLVNELLCAILSPSTKDFWETKITHFNLMPASSWDKLAFQKAMNLDKDSHVPPCPDAIAVSLLAARSLLDAKQLCQLIQCIAKLKHSQPPGWTKALASQLLNHPNLDSNGLSLLLETVEIDCELIHKLLTNSQYKSLLTPENCRLLASQSQLSRENADTLLDMALEKDNQILVDLFATFHQDIQWLQSVFSRKPSNSLIPALIKEEANREVLLKGIKSIVTHASTPAATLGLIAGYTDLDSACRTHLMRHQATPAENKSELIKKESDAQCLSLLIEDIIDTRDTQALQILSENKNFTPTRLTEPLARRINESESTEFLLEVLNFTQTIPIPSNLLELIVLHEKAQDSVMELVDKRELSHAPDIKAHCEAYAKSLKLREQLNALNEIITNNASQEKMHPEAKEASTSLHHELQEALDKLVDKSSGLIDNKKLNEFDSACRLALADEKRLGKIKKHKALWQRILPVLMVFLAVVATLLVIPALAVMVFAKDGYNGFFFKPQKTEATLAVDEIKETLEGLQHPLH